MTYVAGILLIVAGILGALVVTLLVERSRRARAERDLRQEEEKFRLMVEGSPSMIWTARPDTTLDYVNSTLVQFTGLRAELLLDNGWLDQVHPEDRDRCPPIYLPAVAARRPFILEYRIRRSDGAWRWLLDTGVPKHGPDGTFAGYIGSCIDITERRDAEDRIRESQAALEASHREVQQLTGRLIEAQDAERARVARDLHDDVSQQLAGMSIALSGLKRRMVEQHVGQDLQEELRALHQRATALAQNVRNLSHDLHPTVLRHAGLVPALTSYCAELERPHGTVLTCSAEGDFAGIAPDVALCLYRIAQEALRNVIAHASATRAHVRLHLNGDRAEITITDDGRGFDVARSIERGKGLGLVSITERARLAGGNVSVVAAPNQGTHVSAQVPARVPVLVDAGSGAGGGRRELKRS